MDDTGTDQENQETSDSADEGESSDAGESSSDDDAATDDTGSSDDNGSSDDSGSSGGDPDADGARLDELGDRIQSVRSEAEESVAGVEEPDKEEEFHESGSEESAEADDQTAAPPG